MRQMLGWWSVVLGGLLLLACSGCSGDDQRQTLAEQQHQTRVQVCLADTRATPVPVEAVLLLDQIELATAETDWSWPPAVNIPNPDGTWNPTLPIPLLNGTTLVNLHPGNETSTLTPVAIAEVPPALYTKVRLILNTSMLGWPTTLPMTIDPVKPAMELPIPGGLDAQPRESVTLFIDPIVGVVRAVSAQ